MPSAELAVLEVLRRHPARAMTHPELAAQARAHGTALTPEAVLAAAAVLERDGLVATVRATWSDPHLPDPVAVALADDGAAAARHRAQQCLDILLRQLLRTHRCI